MPMMIKTDLCANCSVWRNAFDSCITKARDWTPAAHTLSETKPTMKSLEEKRALWLGPFGTK